MFYMEQLKYMLSRIWGETANWRQMEANVISYSLVTIEWHPCRENNMFILMSGEMRELQNIISLAKEII